ncbi:conjugal transfer protein TraD [Methylobacterium sp. CCH5-D2]|uniref:conjugal transfer protein TraD n=1 Tax=Methylobacterium sp. CCH5-D2 TaxID=1768765 RepID=UPI00082952A3|nr:conjugal transfer protein TraD [Methylobacterium sp. CCH5-D2]
MKQQRDARREDAHKKILLGGLVVKAGLADLPSNVLLGLLIEGRERTRDPDTVERMARLGDKEFKA